MESDTKKVERSKRNLHKLLIAFLKVIPMILALCDVANTTLCFFGIEFGLLSILCGISFLPLLFILLASFALDFCTYHRMFLYYVLLTNALSAYDMYIGIPVSNKTLFDFHCVLLGIFIFLVLYFYQKSRHVTSDSQVAAEDNR